MASCVMQQVNPKEAAELAKVCQQVAERSSRILSEFAQHQAKDMSSAVRDEMGIAKAFMDLYARMAADPAKLASLSMNLWLDHVRLWQSSWMKLMGADSGPVAEPEKGDSRFKDDDWSKNFLFDLIKQSYLISSRHIREAVASVDGLSDESEKKVAFFTRQYVDALSPSNFLLTRKGQGKVMPSDRLASTLTFYDSLVREQAAGMLAYWRADNSAMPEHSSAAKHAN